jgi:hypothetical protein
MRCHGGSITAMSTGQRAKLVTFQRRWNRPRYWMASVDGSTISGGYPPSAR